MTHSLLFICNGHGEDVIALEIIKRLLKKIKNKNIEVLPLVGNGDVFNSLQSKNFRKIGYLKELPSGGFSNQSLKGFVLDLFSGFLIDNLRNFLIVKRKSKHNCKIIAVGDFLPLFFAWCSECEFSFVGTPKSDHTWSSRPGWALSDVYHKLKGSEWDPWEMFLMTSPRCKNLIMRDKITANNLNKKNIPAKYLGNPMMDFVSKKNEKISNIIAFKRIILLIGSRYPEALKNLDNFLDCLQDFNLPKDLVILLPLSINANLINIQSYLNKHGFKKQSKVKFLIHEDSVWKKREQYILIGKGQFDLWASMADVGLSNAGTATEQIAGLGIPSLSLPGSGPQFTKSFAKRQSRLLGGSVLVCKNKKILLKRLRLLLRKKVYRLEQAKIGKKRMGQSGASKKIVDSIIFHLLS
ncbi:MAG: lipid-A-disaccharide synthase-related protein [Prochlorococcus marinus CUG1439]|uniref:lipid-A-disaccharide synthase-related protein n=1 Tax=Prochlorococcus sp. MIT 1314 TaxID=3096220 RepID=UPI002A5FDBD3|nr:lipid-A-disaccharide synthase-related protein [Prochlorococcus sp. MIT 1314]MCR8539156.1 lipid-A-disaccharide synthase-related protein [Prochlorococcus marinus CUG1439]